MALCVAGGMDGGTPKKRGNPNWKRGVPTGNGPGWGGEARGTGKRPPLTADNQPSAQAKSDGHTQAKSFRDMLSPHKQEVADTWLSILRDAGAPHASRITAGEKIALFGGEVLATKQIVEAENIHRIISERPMTEAEWIAQHAPEGAKNV